MSPALGWFSVKDYGAVGDGSNDDTAAINAAIAAWNAAGSGLLYVPHGTYKVTAGLTTISASGLVAGDGMGSFYGTAYVSAIFCTSATAVLFTVTGDQVKFVDIGLFNTYVGTPTAGAGIEVSGTFIGQKVDLDSVAVSGFYINVDRQVGSHWANRNVWNWNPVLYGEKIQNGVEIDSGDWSIVDCWYFSDTYNGTSAIRIEGSGGGKISNLKCNASGSGGKFARYIDLDVAGSTSVLLITNSSFENYTGTAIYLDATSGAYGMVTIHGCQFAQYGNATGNAIYTTGVNQVSVSGCVVSLADAGSPTAISLNNGDLGYVGPVVIGAGWAAVLASSSFTNLLDHSAD